MSKELEKQIGIVFDLDYCLDIYKLQEAMGTTYCKYNCTYGDTHYIDCKTTYLVMLFETELAERLKRQEGVNE